MVILLQVSVHLVQVAYLATLTPMAIAQLQVGILTKLVAALSIYMESAVFFAG